MIGCRFVEVAKHTFGDFLHLIYGSGKPEVKDEKAGVHRGRDRSVDREEEMSNGRLKLNTHGPEFSIPLVGSDA